MKHLGGHVDLHHTFDRRTALRLSGFGAAAWLTRVADLLAVESEHAPKGEPAKSIILLWMAGGPSQLETFDPHAGRSIAGGTRSIRTSVKGIELAEGLPRLAEQMDKIAIVRSLTSKEGDHERGTYLLKTGYRPDPTVVHPSIGAISCHELLHGGTEIPRHVSILPGRWPARGGMLGDKYDAFLVGDPSEKVPDVTSPVSSARLAERIEALDVVERAFARGRSAQVDATRHRATVEQARGMMASEQLAAFDIQQEPQAVRDAYGDSPFGRACLAARRLTEVGVRCIEVTLDGWDSHANNHEVHRELVATLDPAIAALLTDLEKRDQLEQTLVLCGGEFGRTPRINPLGGRDHWPHGFSYVLAGGGVRGGQVIGQTDPEGGREVDQPHDVADIHATVLAALGIDPLKENISPAGRPIKLSEGQIIRPLLG
jgi:hypothetical protein